MPIPPIAGGVALAGKAGALGGLLGKVGGVFGGLFGGDHGDRKFVEGKWNQLPEELKPHVPLDYLLQCESPGERLVGFYLEWLGKRLTRLRSGDPAEYAALHDQNNRLYNKPQDSPHMFELFEATVTIYETLYMGGESEDVQQVGDGTTVPQTPGGGYQSGKNFGDVIMGFLGGLSGDDRNEQYQSGGGGGGGGGVKIAGFGLLPMIILAVVVLGVVVGLARAGKG